MGSGLSMASVNKIKELAAQREYSLALDIIDSQDLTKSLNPQFLRLCGEIFIKSKRYADARKVLVMAHRMAPEAKRIIFDLVELYTKMGYKELVDLYYTIYMYDAEEDSIDTKQLKYLYDKYNGNSIEQIRDYIIPYYTDNMDYDWSFEAYLLLMLYDDEDDEKLLKALVDEYTATYKNSDNCKMLESIRDDKSIANSKFYSFKKEIISDDDISQKEIRREEKKQLEIDNERINPPEATIIDESEEDENEKPSKGFFKRRNKNDEQVDNEEDMNKDSESSDTEDNTSADEKDDSGESEKSDNKKTGLFRRMFSRKKEEQSTDKSETDETDTVEGKQEEVKPDETEVTQEEVKSEEAKDRQEEAEPEEAKDRQEEAEPEEAKDKQEEAEPEEAKNKQEEAEPEDTETFESETPESEIGQETEPVQPETFEESDTEYNEDQNNYIDGEKDMHGGKNSIDLNNEDFFSEDDFDDFSDSENEIDEFAAESETIDELHAKESKSFNFVLKENTDEKPDEEDDNSNKSGKAAFVFEDVDISYEDEDDEEYEIDDFSSSKPDEFGQMYDTVEESDTYADEYKAEAEIEEVEAKTEYEAETEYEPEAEVVEEAETEYEPEAEIEEVEAKTEYEAEPEYESETEVVEEAETEYEPEAEVEEVEAKTEYESEPEYESEAEVVEEAETEYEPEAEVEEVEAKTEYESEPEYESEAEVVEEAETEYEPEAEVEEVEAKTEYESEPEYEPEAAVEEAETEYEPEAAVEEAETESEPEPEEEPEDDLSPEDLRELYRIERDKIKNQNKEKKLDFPVFRSSLFPNYHNDMPEVENNFEEIMTDSKNKIDENFEKEARLQRETEELLASLGINVSSMKPSLKEMETKPQKVEKTVINKEPGISRSQLKDSLKIDANKKTILRKMKEYR